MRTIKFRAWDKENQKFFEPTFEAYKGKLEELHLSLSGRMGLRKIGVYEDESKFPDRFVLMQFTGLLDKNGVEIYESDLMLSDDMYHDLEDGVAINALPDGKIYPVEYREGGFFVGDEFLSEVASNYEVIGNIYENEG